MTATTRITKRVVDQILPGTIVWDCDVKGFAVRCQQRRKVYLMKARIKGRQRWLVIGEHGSPWTPETARHEAQRLWGDIRSGNDPAALRATKREQPTIAELCDRYLDEHARQHKKPLSIEADERNIANHVRPLLGRRLVAEVTRVDIDQFKRLVREGKTARRAVPQREGGRGGQPVRGGPGAANRSLALLSKMFSLAEDWGWREERSNPCRKITRYRERKLERFLSAEELGRVGATLEAMQAEGTISVWAASAIRLLILTGARLGEILTLKWSYVDTERCMLLLPDSKTGAKPILLSEQALRLLATVPRVGRNPYVFIGHREGTHLTELKGPWHRVRQLAQIEDVRIHDLRHSFASMGVLSGGSLPMIGKLLGHTSPQTTARYAHLADDPLRVFNQKVGDAIAAAMGVGETELQLVRRQRQR